MSPTRLLDAFRRTAACAATMTAVALLTASSTQAGSVYTTNCSASYGYGYARGGCIEIEGRLANPHMIEVPQPQSDKEIADAAERERLWKARCRPVIRQDHYGVRRYHYAAPDCEYGKYE
jgi:hypothetical protein